MISGGVLKSYLYLIVSYFLSPLHDSPYLKYVLIPIQWRTQDFLKGMARAEILLHCGPQASPEFSGWGGGNVKPASTYPLSKTENSSDFGHYFLEGAPNSQLKNT